MSSVAAPRALTRRAALSTGALVALGLTGCVGTARRVGSPGPDVRSSWSGRMSLRIESEPEQTFSALFDLTGTADTGELVLTTPIGSTLARLQWSPGEALLRSGNDTRRYPSVDALIEAATGAAIPVGALFGWLAGRAESVPGWRPDLAQVSAGRLQATREAPSPRADLRIAFERT